jgi:translocation and assembly module TamA
MVSIRRRRAPESAAPGSFVKRIATIVAAPFCAAVICAEALAAEDYVVIYDGAPSGLTEKLEKLTNLSSARRPYPTAAAVRRVASEDLGIVKRALVASGYYGAEVAFRIEGDTEGPEKMRAVFSIIPGAKFRIVSHVVAYSDDGDPGRPQTFDAVDISPTDQSQGVMLELNQQRFLEALWGRGYPAARIVARRAEADLEAETATAIYTFESGPRAQFNGINFEGASRTDEAFLRKLRTWEEGDLFDRARLVDYRDRLAETGVFSTIEVSPGAVDDEGTAPVRVVVSERKRRTIGAGVSYSTSEGPGGRLFLEYRNLFGRAERARVEIEGTEISQSVEFDFIKPLPGFPGSAFADFDFVNETTDAYDARSFAIGAGLAKDWLGDRLETRAGLAFETSKVEPNLARTSTIREERNYFASIPLSATWDTEDDPLVLSKGVRASISATPYFGSDQFTRIEAVARSRVSFGAANRFAVAGRLRAAATAGQALRLLPVNKRVYSGGGSSVRGYDYQAVGPLDANGVPIGGRSAVEAAFEARARITKRIQLAAFADAGAVYSEPFPDFAGDYLVGSGLGVRYLSTLGPIRLDAAVPLEKRPTDRDFQIYISLGQPF